VGRVPYLGYFTDPDMNTARVRLEAQGYEVAVREVGAFSTLGWFRDPILPAMLTWDEPRIAETVSHELAHATLWIPGSVDFNESFANVVGVRAGDQFLVHKYGEGSAEVQAARDADHDWIVFQALLGGLYADLDVVYRDAALSDAEKTARKAELYATLDDRVLASDIRQKPRWVQIVRTQTWNNPRLSQFHTYNSGEADFAALLAADGGDVRAFIAHLHTITRGARDPFVALHAAVAALPPPPASPAMAPASPATPPASPATPPASPATPPASPSTAPG
jgi:predicted aminopeptidase